MLNYPIILINQSVKVKKEDEICQTTKKMFEHVSQMFFLFSSMCEHMQWIQFYIKTLKSSGHFTSK